jgi:hypothetical protein
MFLLTGRVEKTARLIIYLNKLNWFTEMYLVTMSNTQMLVIGIFSHWWKLCTHSPFVMDDHAVKHRTNLTWHICIGTVRRNIGIASTRDIRSATGCIIWYKKIKIKVNHIVAGVYLFTQAYIFTWLLLQAYLCMTACDVWSLN